VFDSHPIISPKSDVWIIALGWLIFPLFYFSSISFWDSSRVFKALLLVTLAINFMHRNITMLFAYGDPDEFLYRRRRYIILPIFFALLTGSILYFSPGNFKILATISVLWTIYHVVMQKVGLLRIYTKKKDATTGASLDKGLIWFSFTTLVFKIASLDSTYVLLRNYGHTARLLIDAFTPIRQSLPIISNLLAFLLICYIVYYFLYSYQAKLWSRERMIFLISYLTLLAFFFVDFLAAYAFFSLSHSLEYLALSKHIGAKKGSQQKKLNSPIAVFSRNPRSWFIFYLLFTGALLLIWKDLSNPTLYKFIVGSSFLHFLYDGWLWKLRKPRVAAELELRK